MLQECLCTLEIENVHQAEKQTENGKKSIPSCVEIHQHWHFRILEHIVKRRKGLFGSLTLK